MSHSPSLILSISLLLLSSLPSVSRTLIPEAQDPSRAQYVGQKIDDILYKDVGQVSRIVRDKGVMVSLDVFIPYPDGCSRIVSTDEHGVIVASGPKWCP